MLVKVLPGASGLGALRPNTEKHFSRSQRDKETGMVFNVELESGRSRDWTEGLHLRARTTAKAGCVSEGAMVCGNSKDSFFYCNLWQMNGIQLRKLQQTQLSDLSTTP